MQTTFRNKQTGKDFAPPFFTVYIRKDGTSYKKIENSIDEGIFYDNEGAIKVELYDNRGDSPKQIDHLINTNI